MWVLDCPIKQGEPQIRSYVISNDRKSYIFGSKKGNLKNLDIPIITDLVLSRRQLEFRLDIHTGSLLVKNIGSRSIFLRKDEETEGEQLAAKSSVWKIIKTDSVFYKKDSKSTIELKVKKLKMNSVMVNKRLGAIFGEDILSALEFKVDDGLANDEIVLDGKILKAQNMSSWANRLLECSWKTDGGLYDYLTPEVLNSDITEIPPSDDDMSDHQLITPPPKRQTDIPAKQNKAGDFVNIQPPLHINSQLPQSTEVKVEPQQDSLLKLIMADDDDLRTQPRRRKTKKKQEKHTQNTPSIVETENIPKNDILQLNTEMDNLSVEKRASDVNQENTKRIKLDENPSLVGNIIKAREMKLERIRKDNELVEIGEKSNIKVSKFKVNLYFDQEPTRIEQSSVMDNPDWQNRLNFSKFHKSGDYNPVMDSTIKYMTLKSSKYNSTVAQLDANRHEYLFDNDNVPVFDEEFEGANLSSSGGGRGAYANKRTRAPSKKIDTGPSLFVPSDDESQESHSQSRGGSVMSTFSVIDHANKRKPSPPIKMSILSPEDSEDDDVPVFKAQKRY